MLIPSYKNFRNHKELFANLFEAHPKYILSLLNTLLLFTCEGYQGSLTYPMDTQPIFNVHRTFM